jgi:hypothetical protein
MTFTKSYSDDGSKMFSASASAAQQPSAYSADTRWPRILLHRRKRRDIESLDLVPSPWHQLVLTYLWAVSR